MRGRLPIWRLRSRIQRHPGLSIGSCRFRSTSPIFRVSEEVQQALNEGQPVVALETAVYTHGFPYPANVALASLLESVVRTNGAVPATIGVLDGIARVGLDAEELIRLAGSTGQATTRKVSRRDLPFVCGLGSPGRRYNGGTTIAGTMILAHLAGIKVFATGGLGGVHRGVETHMDISADLTELGRTPVAVISSGCKAFLDIPRTLEYLETEGVAVATFADGRDGEVDFPGFWSRDSGSRSAMTIRTEAEGAAMIHAQHQLGLTTGLCLANPIPEELSIPKAEIDKAIDQAIRDADAACATGNANTPFILNRIKELTGARSVETNRGLLAANAKRGALVAVELAKLQVEDSTTATFDADVHKFRKSGPAKAVSTSAHQATIPSVTKSVRPVPNSIGSVQNQEPRVVVAGSVAVDLACDYAPTTSQASSTPEPQTSNPSIITRSIGGVGQNVARAIHQLQVPVRLCSMMGDDLAGDGVRSALEAAGMDTMGLIVDSTQRTAQYVAVNATDKSLVMAMADMSILDLDSTHESIEIWRQSLLQSKPDYLVVDGNWSAAMLGQWLALAGQASTKAIFEPVSMVKSTRLFALSKDLDLNAYPSNIVEFATPNVHELSAMHGAAREAGYFDRQDWWEVIDSLGIPSSGIRTQLALGTSPELVDAGVPQQSIQLLPFVPKILTKLGAEGVLLTQIIPAGDARLSSSDHAPYMVSRCNNGTEETTRVGGLYMRLFPAAEKVPQEDIVSVNGVGDTFLGAVVAGMVQHEGRHIEDLVPLAQMAAVMTLKSKESVAPGLSNMALAGLEQ